MTLQEAYELQRKELIALRRENKKLKEGTYTDAERAEHEKEIRALTRRLEASEKEKERYHRLWLDARRYGSEESRFMIFSLEKQLREAQDMIAKLRAQMNRDHENSSIPSSQKPFHKKIKNSREKTERKPGAQKGHTGHKRPRMTPTVPVVELKPGKDIVEDPDLYPTGKYITKQIVDLEIQVVVKEYRTQLYRSRSTGRRVHAPFPAGVINEFNYGKNTKALAFLLNNYCNISIDKTRELIQEITDGRVVLSKGFINDLPRQFSNATQGERMDIRRRLLMAPAMYSDATPGRVNGKSVQVILCANPEEMLYCFREHKGHQGIKGTPVEEYQQILVHDHDITYYNYGGEHQECLAHVLRYLQDAMENEPELVWHKQMKEFLSGIIHEAKQDRHFRPERVAEIEAEYDRLLRQAALDYQQHPPNKYYPDGYNLYMRMLRFRDNHLLFLRHPEIEYTNNLSERGLRKFKRKMKQAVTFRCNDSVDVLCNCMSILESHRLHGSNLFLSAQQAFSLT